MTETPEKTPLRTGSETTPPAPAVAEKRKRGRPPGSATQRTREIADKVAASGLTPLEVMLDTMAYYWRRRTRDKAARDKAASIAKDCAPYVHPRLNSVDIGGRDGNPIEIAFRGARDSLATKLGRLLNGHAATAHDGSEAGVPAGGEPAEVSRRADGR